MSRVVVHSDSSPAIVKVGDKEIHICRCGLTTNADGTCSGKHALTKKEEKGKLYCYDEKFNPTEVKDLDGEDGCCGNCHCQ
ncbi:MAG: CDGSH iron-sulfur domain-containing protein [bacterium]